MSERRTVHIDRETGQVVTTVISTEGQTVEEHLEGLQRLVEAQGEDATILVPLTVICDSCGRRMILEEPRLTEGWKSIEGVGELCPRCL